jgi:hypothetical protein
LKLFNCHLYYYRESDFTKPAIREKDRPKSNRQYDDDDDIDDNYDTRGKGKSSSSKNSRSNNSRYIVVMST